MREAVEALRDRRPDLAAVVASGDGPINHLEIEIDDLCLRLLALQHPVGSDLRVIRSILKANTDLERVGDQAVNIAQAAMKLIQLPPLDSAADVEPLAELALAMLHDTMTAFGDRDVDRAMSVLLRDDAADATRDAVLRARLALMMADPSTAERGIALIVVARCLERIADHATNIAEDLIFVVEGRDIRHR